MAPFFAVPGAMLQRGIPQTAVKCGSSGEKTKTKKTTLCSGWGGEGVPKFPREQKLGSVGMLLSWALRDHQGAAEACTCTGGTAMSPADCRLPAAVLSQNLNR